MANTKQKRNPSIRAARSVGRALASRPLKRSTVPSGKERKMVDLTKINLDDPTLALPDEKVEYSFGPETQDKEEFCFRCSADATRPTRWTGNGPLCNNCGCYLDTPWAKLPGESSNPSRNRLARERLTEATRLVRRVTRYLINGSPKEEDMLHASRLQECWEEILPQLRQLLKRAL